MSGGLAPKNSRTASQTASSGAGLGSSASIIATSAAIPRRGNPRRQSSLVREVSEQRPRRDPRLGRDVVDGDAPVAALREQLQGDPLVLADQDAASPLPARHRLWLGHAATGRNTGAHASPAGSNVTSTGMPMCTASGSQPTTLVVNRNPGCSSSSTMAMT